MKTKIRALGIDDAPFKFTDKYVLIVGNIVRAPNYLEGIISTHVEVDGIDATKKIYDMINDSRFGEQVKVIFTDGTAVAGFNMLDLRVLFEKTGIPVISVSRDKPDIKAIKNALMKHFDRWEPRLEVLNKGEIHEVKTEHLPIYIQCEGIDLDEAKRFLKLFTIRGRLPEPIRISHIVASGIVRGESRGKP